MMGARFFIALWLLSLLGSFWAGREWRSRSCELVQSRAEAERHERNAQAIAQVRDLEQKSMQAQKAASDAASTREATIDAQYDARLAAAGNGADYGRLSKLWGQCETDRLSERAAASAEVAGQDRLRRESAARIVRDVETLQSERDEMIERYEPFLDNAG